MLAGDRIRILAVFCSGKVMAKLKNCRVFLTGCTRYENQQSSCRVDSSQTYRGSHLFAPFTLLNLTHGSRA